MRAIPTSVSTFFLPLKQFSAYAKNALQCPKIGSTSYFRLLQMWLPSGFWRISLPFFKYCQLGLQRTGLWRPLLVLAKRSNLGLNLNSSWFPHTEEVPWLQNYGIVVEILLSKLIVQIKRCGTKLTCKFLIPHPYKISVT